tara:strand:+ start:1232 stop:1636 length:405 start_codon:yes stop_codon:yes gene_type:complete
MVFIAIVTVLSAFLAFLLGLLWYSPMLFGAAWRAALKRKPEAKIPMKMRVTLGVLWLFSAIVYSFVAQAIGLSSASDYLIFSGLMFLCFSLPVKIMDVIYAGQARSLIMIEGLYYLTAYILIGMTHYCAALIFV